MIERLIIKVGVIEKTDRLSLLSKHREAGASKDIGRAIKPRSTIKNIDNVKSTINRACLSVLVLTYPLNIRNHS